jgi:3-oxoacyl-[acyl-carrier-protein] synthase III
MIFESVTASFPERKVSNDQMIDLIRHYSTDYAGDLPKTLRGIKARLERSGLVTRNWLADGERPIDHVFQVVTTALEGSALRASDIELFIYVGIGEGFHKLGNSYILAKHLGMFNAECFDVLDACMSWTRAVALTNSLFKTRRIGNALIVNAEFNVMSGAASYPGNCKVGNPEELEYLLPSFTVGEAATATLLLPANADNVSIAFRSKPDCADLCLIPAPGYQGFSAVSETVKDLGIGRFTALGRKIHEQIAEEVPIVLRNSNVDLAGADVVFTHASSMTAWERIGQQEGFGEKIFHIYPETGNIGSASIPAAMALAEKAGKLHKTDKVAFLMGSAGMSFAAGHFVF